MFLIYIDMMYVCNTGDDLKTIMAGYFTIMAAGVAESGIRWAHWYEDGEGLGQQGGPCKVMGALFVLVCSHLSHV
jgi:hypothetical protein